MITTLLFAAALQTSTMTPDAQATPTTPPADLPRCSKTVTDSCMEGGSMGKHHMMKKKTMHHKMAHKTMKKADDTAKMDSSATDKK